MTRLRLMCLALLAPLLIACEPDAVPSKAAQPAADQAPVKTVVVKPALPPEAALVPEELPDPAGAIEPKVSEPLQPTEAEEPEELAYKPPVKSHHQAPVELTTAPKPKLDLSLPKELLKQINEAAIDEPRLDPLLPPLFVPDSEKPSKYQLSGKLHTDDNDGEYLHSIDGAELQIEIKQ